jgi:hypothetical protein
MIVHIIHMMTHPHGWWILLDIALFGSLVTGVVLACDSESTGTDWTDWFWWS